MSGDGIVEPLLVSRGSTRLLSAEEAAAPKAITTQELIDNELIDEETYLPKWNKTEKLPLLAYQAFDRLVENCFHKVYTTGGQDHEGVELNRTVGPAVLWGMAAMFGLTYYLTALPIVGYYIARCPASDGDNQNGFVESPDILLWLLFFFPLATMVHMIEWKCATLALAPMLDFLRRHGKKEKEDKEFAWVICPARYGNQRIPFRIWYYTYALMSVGNLLDNMTNALFTAKMLATKNCQSYELIGGIFQDTMKVSLFAPLVAFMDFADITLVLYVIQLVAQPVYALWNVWPTAGITSVDWTVNSEIGQEGKDKAARQQYDTRADHEAEEDKTDFMTAVMVLAETNRMEVLTSQDMQHRWAVYTSLLERYQKAEDGRERSFCNRNCGRFVADGSTQHGNAFVTCCKECAKSNGDDFQHTDLCNERQAKLEALAEIKDENIELVEIAVGATSRCLARFALKGFIQNALQINLQVTMFAISKTVLNGNVDWGNALTMGMTCIIMLIDIPDMVGMLMFVIHIQKRTKNMEGIEDLPQAHTLRRRIKRFYCWLVLYIGCATYALVKLIFAVGICERGVWNIPWGIFIGDFNHNGCVDIQIDKYTNASYGEKFECRNVSMECKVNGTW